MPLRLAIVGTGRVAAASYLPVLARQADVELRYFNRTRARAEACATRFGGVVAGSIEALLDAPCDGVFLLCAETARDELARAVIARAPRRLFCEKPLVARLGQERVGEDDFARGRELLSLAARAGCEMAMVFNYRFFGQVAEARRLVAERALGRPVTATARVHWACWSHLVDLTAELVGAPARVMALPAEPIDGGSPGVACAFTTADGAAGTLQRVGGPQLANPLYELTIGYERGCIRLRGLDAELELVDQRRDRIERFDPAPDSSQWTRYEDSFRRSLEAWLAATRAGAPPPVPGIAGLRELQIEAAIVRSAREGRAVDLARELPLALASGAA